MTMTPVYATAELSSNGLYRWRLERGIQQSGTTVLLVGVNPSTADAHKEDMSTRKFWGFASRWGCRRYLLGNAFALRTPHVKRLMQDGVDPVGYLNDAFLTAMLGECDFVVPCWGSRLKLHASLRPRLERVTQLIRVSGKPAMCLGYTDSGDPCHPLMLSYETRLVPWDARH